MRSRNLADAWLAPYWRASVDASNAMSAIDGALWDIMGNGGMRSIAFWWQLRPPSDVRHVNGTDLKDSKTIRARALLKGTSICASVRSGDGAGGGAGRGGGGPGAVPGLTVAQGISLAARPWLPWLRGARPHYRQRGPQLHYMNNLINSLEQLRKRSASASRCAPRSISA